MNEAYIWTSSQENMFSKIRQCKLDGKDQQLIQSNNTPDPGHHMGKLQTRKHHILESQEASPFLAGDHKAARNWQDSMTDKHKTQ